MATRKDYPGKSRKAPPAGRKRSVTTDFSTKADSVNKHRRSAKEIVKNLMANEPERGTRRFTKYNPSADRVRRHREAMRAKGLRPITLWVPDTRSPAFLAEAARQCRLANAADGTDPAAAFADDLADELLRDLDERGL